MLHAGVDHVDGCAAHHGVAHDALHAEVVGERDHDHIEALVERGADHPHALLGIGRGRPGDAGVEDLGGRLRAGAHLVPEGVLRGAVDDEGDGQGLRLGEAEPLERGFGAAGEQQGHAEQSGEPECGSASDVRTSHDSPLHQPPSTTAPDSRT